LLALQMYTDKSQVLRPVLRPGLPDAPQTSSYDAGSMDSPALPQSSVTNPYYDRCVCLREVLRVLAAAQTP